MTNNIHLLIKLEYEKRQKVAHDELQAKRDEVYAKIPRIEEIDGLIRLSGIKFNKIILIGSNPVEAVIRELVAKINELKQEKEKLLLEHGYFRDYLDTTYQCTRCKDTGYVKNEFGQEKCVCYRQQVIDLLYKQSNLKLSYTENFSTFDEDFYPDMPDEKKYGIRLSPRENILRIKDRSLKFIDNFDSSEEKNLFFSGPTGVGKTFMSNCIAMEILNKGRTVLYQTAPKLFDTISQYKMKSYDFDDFEDSGYKNIYEVELLIIDDLGTESLSDSRFAEFLNILNSRQVNNLSRPCKTIISTNIGARELHQYYDERVASRIIGSFDMFRFAGEDIRRVKKMVSVR